jgi:NarL family two-component system response regulator LiaR
MDKISVLIADDHPLVRDSISYLLQGHNDFEVVAQAGDGEEAVKLVGELSPDVVIMDIEMPKVDGLEATRQIKSSHPQAAVLALTIHDDEEFVEAMLEAGAAGYLLKSAYGEELLQAIRAVKLGEFVLDSRIGSRVFRNLAVRSSKKANEPPRGNLSPREIEVMKLVAQGMTNDEITSSLSISLNTVKRHLMEIFSKLGAGSRSEALVVSLRSGILSMEDLA